MPFETRLADDVTLRELAKDDAVAVAHAYARNREHLEPWDPARPEEFFTEQWHKDRLWVQVLANTNGSALHTVLESADGEVVGRLNLTDIVRGAFENGHVGYWIDARYTGRGLMTAALLALADHARDELGLHRLQAATLPHNVASQAVLGRAGFEKIGYAPSYLKIAGSWQDHVVFQRILHD
ncbi:GNAT family N-acetyltransferase [Promicromonospora citrea]|uniref:Ribosomal-protein-alanine acetyltransferase n=1 Tax=Promicromonospora citrea TaxID=43677 RepID=A0A8H9GFJ7_9MICO|nr:GNAT family N-acetyltransferase [Promicromonospora citrea]NNH52075.1 GNAT family N-acetyltransferase [Promicromonospora citrea]GGM20440.1 ribosomal-protein-alanine acetyltransferase [Promicromonospora citrea]